MIQIHCPACKKPLTSAKALPKHTNGCPRWDEVIGVPPSHFNFDRYFQRGIWEPQKTEPEDFVSCRLCAHEAKEEFRAKRLADHLKREHGMTAQEYWNRFPNVLIAARSTNAVRAKTNQERYGVDNVWQSDDVKEKTRQAALAKYGVDHHRKAPEVQQKCAATNLQRYGVENVFAAPEIQEKIRNTNLERYGATNPQQVPVIRRKTEDTMLAKYGAKSFLLSKDWFLELVRQRDERAKLRQESLLASNRYEICSYCGEIFTKVTSRHKAICEGWPKGPEPEPCLCGHICAGLTSMKLHRNQCMVWQTRDRGAVCRTRTVNTLLKKYGVSSIMAIDGVKERIARTNLRKYGAVSISSRQSKLYPKIQKSLVGRRVILRGVQNAFSWVSVKEKILRSCLSKVGHALSVYDSPAISMEDLQSRYGIIHPMQDRDYAKYRLEGQSTHQSPNKVESALLQLEPRLYYTGNRKFWRWLPRLGHHKNPDFIVPGPDAEHPYRDVAQVVEVFGDYWHSERFTGKSPIEHAQELVEAYSDIGLSCLVLWESEIKRDSVGARTKLLTFLDGSVAMENSEHGA